MAKKKKIKAKLIKQLKKLASDKKIADLRALAGELGDSFVAAAVQAALLELAVERGAVGVIELLLEAGVDADARPGLPEGQSAGPDDKMYVYDNPGPLMRLVSKTKIKKADRVAWAERLIAAGASPATTHPDLRIINPAHRHKAHSPLDLAVITGAYDLVEQLLPLCDAATRASATVTALRAAAEHLSVANYWHTVDRPLKVGALKKLVKLGLPWAGVSRWGLPVAHAIALFASVEVFELLAQRCADLTEARIADQPVVLRDVGVWFDGGYGTSLASDETVTLGPDTSPRAAVRQLICGVERGIEERRSRQQDDWIPPLEAQIQRLQAIAAQLEARGDAGAGGALVVPEQLRPLFDLFSGWLGRDEVEAFAGSQDLTSLTPYLLALRLAEAFAGAALQQRLAPRPEHPIAVLLDHARRSASPRPTEVSAWVDSFGDTQHNPEETLLVHPDDYHEGGRELLETGRLFAAEGGVVWGVEGLNGEGELFAVSPDATVVHGPVNDLLQDFLRA